MGREAQQILREVLEKSNNDIIMLTIVLVIGIAIAFVPLYRLMVKDRKDRLATEAQRAKDENNAQLEHDRIIIQVVTTNTEAMTRNTEAITSLKATLDNNSKAYYASLDRIHERMDSIAKTNTDIWHDVKQILQVVDKEVA